LCKVCVLEDVKNRGKGFLPHNSRLCRHLHQGWAHIKGIGKLILQHPLATGDDAALRLGLQQRQLHGVERIVVNQGANQGALRPAESLF
jgi:hypothetical protein